MFASASLLELVTLAAKTSPVKSMSVYFNRVPHTRSTYHNRPSRGFLANCKIASLATMRVEGQSDRTNRKVRMRLDYLKRPRFLVSDIKENKM